MFRDKRTNHQTGDTTPAQRNRRRNDPTTRADSHRAHRRRSTSSSSFPRRCAASLACRLRATPLPSFLALVALVVITCATLLIPAGSLLYAIPSSTTTFLPQPDCWWPGYVDGWGSHVFRLANDEAAMCAEPDEGEPAAGDVFSAPIPMSEWRKSDVTEADHHALAYLLAHAPMNGTEDPYGFSGTENQRACATFIAKDILMGATVEENGDLYHGDEFYGNVYRKQDGSTLGRIKQGELPKILELVEDARDHAGTSGWWDACLYLRRNTTHSNLQDVLVWYPLAKVTFTKVSADASLTKGNAEYAYSGASYDIYDASTDERVASITTDDEGKASCYLPYGSYYAIETKAPQGFIASTKRHEFTIAKSAKTAAVRLADEPGSVSLVIQKKDSATKSEAQLGATLEGAEYKAVDAAGKTHTATTDEQGTLRFEGLPLGKIVITETRAPEGYRLDTTPRTHTVRASDLPASGVVELEPQDDYLEDVIVFDLEISKYRSDGTDESGVQTPSAGVAFEIISNTSGEVVGTITTDDQGYATTEGSWFGAGERPSSVSGALPYDAAGYTVREDLATTPAGYQPAPDWIIDADNMADGTTLRYIVNNEQVTSYLQIVKCDSETGASIPLAGFTFALLDENKEPVSQEAWYPNHTDLSEFTTDETGAVTLPAPLKPGTYYIRETATQAPYLLGSEDVSFTISGSADTPPVTVVRYENAQAMGIARVQKVCSDADASAGDGCSLAGAEFDVIATQDVISPDGTVRAVGGEVVDHIVTDDDGTAETKPLWLGMGSATYALVETKPPSGHALDETPHTFTLSYEGDQTETVYIDVEVENHPTTLVIDKTITGSGEALAGVRFELWRDEDEVAVSPENGCGAAAVRSGDAGEIVLERVEKGASEATDSEAAPQDPVDTKAAVRENDHTDLELFGLTYDEALDAFTSASLHPGSYRVFADGEVVGELTILTGSCTFAVVADGQCTATNHLLAPGASPVSLTTNEEGVASVEHLAPGTYLLEEASAPAGYLTDSSVLSVTVDANGRISGSDSHAISVEDDYTKVELSKRDITDESEVPGASLMLIDSNGTLVESWVSGETPHRIDRLAPGTYTLIEEMTPHEYDHATEVTFTVQATGEVQQVTMYDEPIEVSGSVDKRQEIADPVASGVEADESANRAPVSISNEGEFDYSVDFRSTSSTWVDEFTVTDELEGIEAGLAVLDGITTPQAAKDFDGKLNVWYRTNKSAGEEHSEEANATFSDRHENPWLVDESNKEALGEDGRALSYDGWRLWAKDIPSESATRLSTDELDLAEDEVVTGVRLEYGRVEEGFTSRAADWDRDDVKHVHDDLADVVTPHEDEASSSDTAMAPLVLHMRATPAYTEGTTLSNSVRLDLFRNGGNSGDSEHLEGHDEDRVEQAPKPHLRTLAQTGVSTFVPALVTGAVSLLVVLMFLNKRKQQ